jgi:hypothetical protein
MKSTNTPIAQFGAIRYKLAEMATLPTREKVATLSCNKEAGEDKN